MKVKHLLAMQVDPGSVPGSGRSAGEGICYPLQYFWASLVAQLVKKNLPAKVFHCNILAWGISWTVWGHKESDTTEQLALALSTFMGYFSRLDTLHFYLALVL